MVDRLKKAGRAVVSAVPQVVQLAGLTGVVIGIGLVCVPAAFIVGGCALVGSIELAAWQERRAAVATEQLKIMSRMHRGDQYS